MENVSAFYLNDTFYLNDPSSIERVSEMLSDIWKRGVELSEITTQVGLKLPVVEASTTETVADLVSIMLKKGVTSILINEKQKPIGMTSDRDLLKEIVEKKKDPNKTLVKDIAFTPLVILDHGESIMHAFKMMREKGMERVAMVKNGHLVGMLTEDLAMKRARLAVKTEISQE
jgi:predicted transcriptional regulator